MKKLLAASAAFFVLAGLALGQGYPQNNAKRIWGLNIAIPAAGDDGQFLRYNHATGYSWEGITLTSALLSATHTDTTAAAVSRGALITGQGASPAWTLLAKGTAGQLLTMGADEPGWAAAPAEADTLATVTGRGATTDTAVGLNGGLSVDTPAFVVANATGAVSTTAMPTVAIAGGNAATEALQLTHTTPSVAAETAATLAISFDFVNSIDSGAGQEEAARIEVYKWGDWFNVSPNDDDDDSGLKLYTTQDGDQTLRLTVGDGTSALNVAAINAAGGSATAVTINPTLGIMDGSDTWTGVSIAPTNANHTGASNTVTGISVGAITGDPDATETALSIGSGWDVGLNSASKITATADAIATTLTDRIGVANTTASTGGATVQQSPAVRWEAHAWDSAPGEDNKHEWRAYVVPVSAATTTSTWKLGISIGGAAETFPLTITNAGNVTGLATFTGKEFYTDTYAAGLNRLGVDFAPAGVIRWGDTSVYATFDTGLSRASAGVVKITDGSTGSGSAQAKSYRIPLTADAVLQVGQIVMVDASADGRFDANTASEPTQMGVYAGTGASAQGTVYDVVVSGQAYVAPAEDVAATRGHWLYQSATAGYAADTATYATADSLIIGQALYSEAIIEISTATAGTDVLVMASDPAWVVNDPVIYWDSGGSAITGLTDGSVYWIKTESTTSITLSATKGGAVLDIGGDWSAADGPYLIRLPQAVINPR